MKRRTFLKQSTAAAAAATMTGSAAFAQSSTRLKSVRTIRGSNMAYVDQGSGRPVVFLHGNPTSSYLWRNIIPYVTDTHRAIAPDLIGMGDSDKPDIGYTYQDHADHLFELLDSFDLRDAVLVTHDWGSALGPQYARTRPDRVSGLVLLEPLMAPSMPFASYEAMGPDVGGLFKNLRTEGVGEQMVLEENFFVEQILGQMMVVTPLSDEVMTEYRRPFPTPESRKPTLQWPREVPIGGEPEIATAEIEANNAWIVETDLPVLMFWSEPGVVGTKQAAEWFDANVRNVETSFVGAGLHYIQEDQPEAIGAKLAEWLKRI